MNISAMETQKRMIEALDVPGIPVEAVPYGNGHINHTLCLTTKEPDVSEIEVAIASLKAALPEIYPPEPKAESEAEPENPDASQEQK